MDIEPRLDILGAALADQSRARILCELMDGRSHTNKELAFAAGITAQTASGHLGRLQNARLTVSERSGRHNYHRIASAEVAEVLESLAGISPTDHLYRAKRGANSGAEALIARTCYNHIAGRLGVLISQRLVAAGALLETQGRFSHNLGRAEMFVQLGIALPTPQTNGAPFAKCCLDWTERRTHISGHLGMVLLEKLLHDNWLQRKQGSRALTITPLGSGALQRFFDITQSDLNAPHPPRTVRSQPN